MQTEIDTDNYDAQAKEFLRDNGLAMQVTLSNTKQSRWEKQGRSCGNHYRVRFYRKTRHYYNKQNSVTFDFWGSQHAMMRGKALSPYDVLASIACDVNCPETFGDFCSAYDYDLDSRSAFEAFEATHAFAVRLRRLLTTHEIEQLTKIQ